MQRLLDTSQADGGRRTAAEAYALAVPFATKHGSEPLLLLLKSHTDIDQAGRSVCWELLFEAPLSRLYVLVEVGACGEGADAATIRERISPSGPPRPPVPVPFRDSSSAVAHLAAHGVDFIAGDPDMNLSAEVLPSGEAVWRLFAYDDEYRVPLGQELSSS